MKYPKVYVIVLNYIKWEDSWDCIISLLASTYEHFSILMVDNCSENNSLERLTALMDENFKDRFACNLIQKRDLEANYAPADLAKITFIQNDENTGFAAGNNLALDFIKDEDAFVWLLNPDMTVRNDTLDRMVQYALKQDLRAIVGAEVRISGGEDVFFYGGSRIDAFKAKSVFITEANETELLDTISGSCLFTHLSNFKLQGLLPEDYFLFWEETDWCYGAKLKGYQLMICDGAVCYVKVSSTIGKGFLSDYYYVRNGLYFVSKYNKGKLPFVFLFSTIRYIKRMMTGQWGRAKGVYKGTIDFCLSKKGRGH